MPKHTVQNIPSMETVTLALMAGESYKLELTECIRSASEDIVNSDSPESVIFALSGLYKVISAWELSCLGAEELKRRSSPD